MNRCKWVNLNNKIELLIGGDLINQITITSYNLINRNIPFLGIYNACATFNESLIILANYLENKNINNGISITSSHNLNSERQYRFPIEYGSQKKKYTTFTTTGAVCTLLTNEPTNIKIESSTIGTVVDYGIKDASNMGAIMAPSAAETLDKHLKELNRDMLKQYLTFQYSVGEDTFFKNVYKLRPGHYFKYKNGDLKIKKYLEQN